MTYKAKCDFEYSPNGFHVRKVKKDEIVELDEFLSEILAGKITKVETKTKSNSKKRKTKSTKSKENIEYELDDEKGLKKAEANRRTSKKDK